MQLLTLSVPPAAEHGQVGRILPQILQQRASVLGEMSKEVSKPSVTHWPNFITRNDVQGTTHGTCTAYIHASLLSFVSIQGI